MSRIKDDVYVKLYFVEFVKWRHRGEVCRLRVHLISIEKRWPCSIDRVMW